MATTEEKTSEVFTTETTNFFTAEPTVTMGETMTAPVTTGKTATTDTVTIGQTGTATVTTGQTATTDTVSMGQTETGPTDAGTVRPTETEAVTFRPSTPEVTTQKTKITTGNPPTGNSLGGNNQYIICGNLKSRLFILPSTRCRVVL